MTAKKTEENKQKNLKYLLSQNTNAIKNGKPVCEEKKRSFPDTKNPKPVLSN